MKYIRVSVFPDEGVMPMTMVFPEGDLQVPLEVAANSYRMEAVLHEQDADVEVFDGPEDLETATAEAFKRSQARLPDDYRHAQTLNDFLVAAFYTLTPDGLVEAPGPTPISAEAIRDVVLRAMTHPKYERQKIRLPSNDGKIVQGLEGQVLVTDKEG